MTETRVRLWMIAAAIMLLLAAGLVWSGEREHPQTARPSAATCPDVELVLVPGNGQGSGTDPGPTLTRFAGALRTQLGSRRVIEQVVVASTSQPARVLAARYPRRAANAIITAAQVRRWETGINAVAQRVQDLVQQAVAACPNRPIVLAGYSQGAGSVHRALLKIGERTSVGRRITGVVLFGDPDRMVRTRALSPVRPAHSGIEQVRRVQTPDVPTARSVRTTYSVCLKGDLICDFGPQSIRSGVAVHGSYPTGPALLFQAPARDFAGVIRGIPLVTPGAPVVQGMVADPAHRQIDVVISSRMRSHLVFSAGTALPPGLQLTSTGLLTGLPSAAGRTVIRYRVRNTADPKYGLPVVGYLTVVIVPNRGPRVSAGGETTCRIALQRTLECWGDNRYGQIGDGTRTNRPAPTQVGTGTTWVEVATSSTHTCGIRASGTLWCWGSNTMGQLGDSTQDTHLRPYQIATFGRWRSVSVNQFNSCAVTTNDTLWCWGNNRWGQLGIGTTTQALRPRPLGSGWSKVSVGAWSACGIRTDGALRCWGANDLGQVGDGTNTGRLAPVAVAAGTLWTDVSVGSMHACGVLSTGQARCWGANFSGQLGTGGSARSRVPAGVFGGAAWRAVSAGDQFSCGIRSDSSVWCWGAGILGQRGVASTATVTSPVRVADGFDADRLSAGWSHACGTDADVNGAVSCWGFDARGQLGNAGTGTRYTPERVAGP